MKKTAVKKELTSVSKNKTLRLNRYFSQENIQPYDQVEWVKTDAVIAGSQGPSFEQKNVEFPNFYSQNAINIISSKYFRFQGEKKEKSLKNIIDRVVKIFRAWAEDQNYFRTKTEAEIFENELTFLILDQRAWFNSPIWFNVGVKEKPQCSACFILSVEDSMESILNWIKTEGLIFKNGSGSGINLSPLRGKGETLNSGGSSSGPISFMTAADAVAGSIKSGGSTRRAAKMLILNADHPDILEFIQVKTKEEDKIRALIEAGYDLTDMNNPLWQNIFFQNGNNSIRIPDELMTAALADEDWPVYNIHDRAIAKNYKARFILEEIAKAAWSCGDPGVQFDTTIQKWHTCKNSDKINATNPCAEYIFLDNTSCNLSSINLLKYLREDDSFDIEGFKQTARIMFMAQDLLIDKAGYPTSQIEEETRKYRTIGLGYANLGALLMALGLPYDSDEGRAWAASLTALLTGQAYKTSAQMAAQLGPFEQFEQNREPMFKIIEAHREKINEIDGRLAPKDILAAARKIWNETLELGQRFGFRNAQATVLAPTGTIGLAMDCDTTGVEPDFALVKMKQLVGGGYMTFVNKTVKTGLKRLGYNEEEIKIIVDHLEKNRNIETAPILKSKDLAVFDCAVKPTGGQRSIHWRGHVKMVAAVQPFISGGISKTFNMPNEAGVDEIYNAYIEAWKLGIKCFAVYRDGSKATQALYSGDKNKKSGEEKKIQIQRKKLPDRRASETHKFTVAGHEGFLTYSFYEDGNLGEIFIRMSKQGSTLSGLLDAFSISVSIALQYGVPLKTLAQKFIHMRFEPMGVTNNDEIRIASSIIDYIFKYLSFRFFTSEELFELGLQLKPENYAVLESQPKLFEQNKRNSTESPGPPCKFCGGLTMRTGSCYTCVECGESSGGCG
ncbi:vitamin B12-dependent ribonucleotide reductase [Patescibacteria group bacterium]|nr:vitamin B12-dependent ribonucleotide reductase [Patescibacteria group bacterium]